MYQSVMHKQIMSVMPLMCAVTLMVTACASKGRSEWDAIDYSSVYRKANQRENDSSYTPSTGGCMLDDDFACQ